MHGIQRCCLNYCYKGRAERRNRDGTIACRNVVLGWTRIAEPYHWPVRGHRPLLVASYNKQSACCAPQHGEAGWDVQMHLRGQHSNTKGTKMEDFVRGDGNVDR